MSTRNKRIATVSLVVLAAAVWVPQLLASARREPPPARPEVGNEGAPRLAPGAARELAPTAPAETAEAAAEIDAAHAERESESSPGADLGGELETAIGWVEVLTGERERIDLDELVAAFGARDGAAIAPYGGAVNGDPLAGRVPGAPAADELAAFLDASVLRGVLHDGAVPVAVLGDRVVREGDVLPGGIEVVRIGRREVWLGLHGWRAVAELPAFVARPAVQSGAGGSGGTEAGAAPVAEVDPSQPEGGASESPSPVPDLGGN